MRAFNKALLTALLSFCSAIIFAQGNAGAWLNQGLELQKQNKHAEAIAKFKEALQAEPDNPGANYQVAFSLVATKSGTEAIPYAEKVIKTSSAYTAAAFSLLGGIYDAGGQATKAIEVYKEGLKVFPKEQNMWFNLGLACFRDKQYADAEQAAIEAIKLDTRHANSQRLYALVAFHQNKRMNALLGLCSFLITEPNSLRAEEAYTNIQSILKGGVLKGADTKELSPAEAKEAATLNAGITSVINSSAAQKLSGVALLQYQFKSIFIIAGNMASRKPAKNFFDSFFAAWFYNLEQSNNTEALAQLISKSNDNAAYQKWFQANPAKAAAFDEWVSKTPRSF